ncbi:MAG: Rne/Rng family ribonuclease, partial [Terriglobales bacterium]
RGRSGGAPQAQPAPEAAAPAGSGEEERERDRGPRLIGELLRAGQEILVQIAKEPLGTKGARITSHLALPGRFLVYMPTVHHIGVSRKIGSDEERARLKRVILENARDLPGGFIVRTASQGISDEDLKADIRFLGNLWADIRHEFEQRKSPALLHHDLGLLERTLRDQLSDQFTHIWVDSEEQYQAVVRFIDHFMPKLTGRVRLYTRDESMFDHFGIQDEIDKALKSKVWLKSGGYIVINQTEALVAIDVNTGKYVGKSNRLEDTIVKTNVDAIREIVRQIRLRDLGGIIVIDFIDMDERKNRHKVMQALDEAMRADRAPSKVLSFNDFGLVALTRKRVKQSLERTLGSPCPYCTGVGLVKSTTTVCNEIYAEVRKMAKQIDREDLVLRVNPEIAKALKSRNARLLSEMEEASGKAIAISADPLVHQEQFEIF